MTNYEYILQNDFLLLKKSVLKTKKQRRLFRIRIYTNLVILVHAACTIDSFSLAGQCPENETDE